MRPVRDALFLVALVALVEQPPSTPVRIFAAASLFDYPCYNLLAHANIYRAEHPWTLASRWVYENVPAGTLLASEQWDDSLPTSMDIDGELRRRAEYADVQLTWLTGPDELDNEAKLEKNLARHQAEAEKAATEPTSDEDGAKSLTTT